MSMTTGPDRPTRVRHLVVGLTTLMAVLLYLDRFCLSISTGYIKEDLGLSNFQAGVLLSAFFWTYAFAQVPSGWLSDRFGARRVLSLYIVGWSLFTGLVGVAHSFLLLLAFRFGCGLAQAGAYPTSAALVSRWVPFRSRGLASGIVSTGGRLGGFIAPILTIYLIVRFVPATTSSVLGPDDLLDPAGLCRALNQNGNKPVERLAALIREQLPSNAQQVVAQGSAPDATLSAEDQKVLADGLNALLSSTSLGYARAAEDFSLPPEARGLLGIPGGQLLKPQRERCNRLLLEAAFPEQVRKVYGNGWRPVMLLYGVGGLAVAAAFWLLVRDRPQAHPACNPAEIALIESGLPPTAAAHGRAGTLPLGAMLRHTSLSLSCASQFFTNFGWVFLMLWLPSYLEKVHGVSALERGWMASVPILLGMAGMLAGGWVTDVLTGWLGLRWGRCLPIAVTRFAAMAAFLACLGLGSPWAATAALSVVAVATDLGTPATWAFMQDVGGRNVGSILGWGNTWGNIGAAVSPIILGWLIDRPRGWDLSFLLCAATYLAAGVVSLGIDARIPVVPSDEKGHIAPATGEGTQA
jgi:ACS family glucarate transporter-like MFS transporter